MAKTPYWKAVRDNVGNLLGVQFISAIPPLLFVLLRKLKGGAEAEVANKLVALTILGTQSDRVLTDNDSQQIIARTISALVPGKTGQELASFFMEELAEDAVKLQNIFDKNEQRDPDVTARNIDRAKQELLQTSGGDMADKGPAPKNFWNTLSDMDESIQQKFQSWFNNPLVFSATERRKLSDKLSKRAISEERIKFILSIEDPSERREALETAIHNETNLEKSLLETAAEKIGVNIDVGPDHPKVRELTEDIREHREELTKRNKLVRKIGY